MKGMQKIKRGTGFNGLLKYALSHEKAVEDGRIIGGTMNGFDVSSLSKEFGKTRALRRDIEKPVWHNSLRLPAGDECGDMKWDDIAQDYMHRMGFDIRKTQYVVVKHDDENAIHIIANRVQKDGSLYLGRNENLASTRHISDLEKAHGLTLTKGLVYDDKDHIVPGQSVHAGRKSAKEVQKQKRTGELLPKDLVKAAIKAALAKGPCSAPVFAQRVKDAGINVRASVASSASHKMNGFSFEAYDDSNAKNNTVVFKGSQVGYSWLDLQNAGVTYDASKDYRNIVSITNNKADVLLLDKATTTKQEQWDVQAAALDADTYLVHCDRGQDGDQERIPPDPRHYTALEVRAAIPALESIEDRGYTVAVVPVSDQWHYLRVEDIKQSGYERMKAVGYVPNLVVRLSQASGVAVVRVPKVKDAASNVQALQVSDATKVLTSTFGTGGASRNSKIPLAGFKINSFVSDIITSSKAICSKALSLFNKVRSAVKGPSLEHDDVLDKLGFDLSEDEKKALQRKAVVTSPAPTQPQQKARGPSLPGEDEPAPQQSRGDALRARSAAVATSTPTQGSKDDLSL